MSRQLKTVCVYCASSNHIERSYLDAAAALGRELAQHDITIVYGGSSLGAMGALADGGLEAGGRVVGVMPQFMVELEWSHRGLTELRLVEDMHQRKTAMMVDADGIVALPGGSGTFEELLEALALKRLGLYFGPIVLANLQGYYDPLVEQFRRAVEGRFMDQRHVDAWTVVTRIEDVLPALRDTPDWDANARSFAQVRADEDASGATRPL